MFTCPCCGYEVFSDYPGSYDICPICFWEDDVFQPRRRELIGAEAGTLKGRVVATSAYCRDNACIFHLSKVLSLVLPAEFGQ